MEPEASREANGPGRSGCAPSAVAGAGKTAVGVTTRSAEARPRQVGGGAAGVPVGLGEVRDTGCGERGVGDSDRTVVLFVSGPEEQKLRFQGADHFAALCGLLAWGWKVGWAGILRSQRPCSRPCWSTPGFPRELCGATSRVPLFSMDSLDGFIDTFSGLRFWPLLPNPDDILVEDIAHALAHQCRFGGHASKFYSVAEHSVHVSQLCLSEHALWGLLHDASEAFLVDLPRPLKQLPEFAPYREAERRLQRAVALRFGLPEDQPASVTEADDTMLGIEARSLLGSMPVEVTWEELPPFEIADPLLPVEAERLFLSRFKELSS